MSRNTMSFALPESMQDYVADRVRSGEYGNASEYVRALIRQDQHEQAARRLRQLITEGLESGEGRPVTSDVVDELRKAALDTQQ